MSRQARSCSGCLKTIEYPWTGFKSSRVLFNPSHYDELVAVDIEDSSLVYLSKRQEETSLIHMDGVYVSCFCWGPLGNTIWVGNGVYVSIVEFDRSGNWLRNVYVGAGSAAIACDEKNIVVCLATIEDNWPKLVVLDYTTGTIKATLGTFGSDAGLLCPFTTHVAIVGSYYIVGIAEHSYFVRVDVHGNFVQVNLEEGGSIIAICSAHNDRDVYVSTSRMPHDVRRVDIFTGVVQNAWSLPKDLLGRVTDIMCIQADKSVTVFSDETQVLYTYV